MSDLERAARVGDPIEHSHKFLGGIAGAILAGVVIGALIVAAPEVIAAMTVVAACTAASTAITGVILTESVGETIGGMIPAPNAGDIADGAHTVFTGPTQARAARMSDPVKCHPGQTIAEGSKTVFMENWNASRKGDATMCAGKIQDGCPTVLIGGPPIGRVGSKNISEIPWWWQDGKIGLGWVGTALGLVGKTPAKLAVAGAGMAVKAYSQTNLPGHKEVGMVGNAAVTAAGLWVGGAPKDLMGGAGLAMNVTGQADTAVDYARSPTTHETYDP